LWLEFGGSGGEATLEEQQGDQVTLPKCLNFTLGRCRNVSRWKKMRCKKILSDNRDFLRGLAPEHYFEVMLLQEFCEAFDL